MSAHFTAHTFIKKAIAIGNQLVESVLPPQCASCYKLTGTANGLCSDCWQELSFIEQPLCDRLGIPFAYDPGPGIISAKALAQPPVWNRARAGVEFNDTSRKLIHALKYYDRHEVATLMALIMHRAGTPLFAGTDIIIPVPLYPIRQWQRRFNQSAMLAKRVAESANITYRPDLLVRAKPTKQQVGLKGPERRKNVSNAFTINPERAGDLNNANIILIDDVVTTGATVGECSKVLLSNGCQRVDILTFALVNNPLRIHM